MAKDLRNKVAVVTGAASGIGLALAEALGARGMKLVLADIEESALAAAESILRAKGCAVAAIRTDVSQFESVAELARRTSEVFGSVHILCNNAGVSLTGPLWELTLDDWHWVHGVNLWGVIHGLKAFIPAMIAHGEDGHVINTASLASFVSIGHHAAYCSSKAAVMSISQALHGELRAGNTRLGVTVMCPGVVQTGIHRSSRNRPAADRSWTERDRQDPEFQKGAARFQADGVLPESAAQSALDAMDANRFYAFCGDRKGREAYLRQGLKPVLDGGEPPVLTWGPDERPRKR